MPRIETSSAWFEIEKMVLRCAHVNVSHLAGSLMQYRGKEQNFEHEMPNEITPYSGLARATEETAKAANNAIGLVRDLGPFIDKVLGRPIEHLVGMTISDPLWAAHRLSLDWIQRRVEDILHKRDIRHGTKKVAPALLIPLLDAAQGQTNDELRELWARLLANALDPNREDGLRIQFIETLRQFHPRDALILLKLAQIKDQHPNDTASEHLLSSIPRLTQRQLNVSISVLRKLDCVETTTAHVGVYISSFGGELIEACSL